MASIEALHDELAFTKSNLDQATVLLAEKDQEISALREELAQLHRIRASNQLLSSYSTAAAVVEDAREHNSPQSALDTPAPPTPEPTRCATPASTSSEDERTKTQDTDNNIDSSVQHDSNDNSHDKNPAFKASDWPLEDHIAPSGGWPDESPAPTGPENQSPALGSCEKDWACTWEQEASNGAADPWPDHPKPDANTFDIPKTPKWKASRLRPESKDWLHGLMFKKAHTMSDEMYKDIIELHVLPLKTRLEDDDWMNSDLQHVRIDNERQFRLLASGKELGQKCLWGHLDKHEPHIRDQLYPGGWQQVKLEFDALGETLPMDCLSCRGNDSWLAKRALHEVVFLRHAICHWDQSKSQQAVPRFVDKHLKNVQKLAINLYDEESAMEARRLRDEARQAVEDTVAELEALEPQFNECEFKYYHKLMFWDIENARYWGELENLRLPGVVFRAEAVWLRRSSSLNAAFVASTNQQENQHEDEHEGQCEGQQQDQQEDQQEEQQEDQHKDHQHED